eukprot:scaffold923_cov256-Pinguiococcus_pyrenoidosus.AAC.20
MWNARSAGLKEGLFRRRGSFRGSETKEPADEDSSVGHSNDGMLQKLRDSLDSSSQEVRRCSMVERSTTLD